MSSKDTPKKQRSEAEIRESRLKQALKANLARRKAQSRGRRADDMPDGAGAAQNDDSMSGKDSEQEG
ncbi:MAG: hypothetical protein WEB56_10540 [Roseovarius sp.]